MTHIRPIVTGPYLAYHVQDTDVQHHIVIATVIYSYREQKSEPLCKVKHARPNPLLQDPHKFRGKNKTKSNKAGRGESQELVCSLCPALCPAGFMPRSLHVQHMPSRLSVQHMHSMSRRLAGSTRRASQ